jgi:hypothetical protein
MRDYALLNPAIAPVLWSFLLISWGFLLCVVGGQFLLDKGMWRLVGVAMFGIGSLLGAAGILPWGFWR